VSTPPLTAADIQKHLDNLTKPPGSLGRLETLAAELCRIQQTLRPVTRPRSLVLFAGDHGVVAEGVTAWPSSVTGLMITNIVRGGAASSVLAVATNTRLRMVDVGSLAPEVPSTPTYSARKVRAGTRNLAREAALTVDEFLAAVRVGQEEAERELLAGAKMLATGEMGIGNTTPAACLAMLLADVPLQQAVGRGAGSDDVVLARKRQVVDGAVARARLQSGQDRIAAVASVCGLEIAAMAGFYMAGARGRATLVLDGYIATAAALIAEDLQPGTMKCAVGSHLSAEPGHAAMLQKLNVAPCLHDWGMRLGEGTGALTALPLLDAAAAICGEMATFAQAGIDRAGDR